MRMASTVAARVTERGCEIEGCSNQTGEPNSSPVDFL